MLQIDLVRNKADTRPGGTRNQKTTRIQMNLHCSFQPFAARYFASRAPFNESDTLDTMLAKSDVYAQRDNLTGRNAPFVYRGRAFGQTLDSATAKRVIDLLLDRAHGSGIVTENEVKGVIDGTLKITHERAGIVLVRA